MFENFGLYIDGKWRAARKGAKRDVINPATEEAIGAIPVVDTGDLDDALASADRGFKQWRRTSPWDRSAMLRRTADLMRERVEEIARTMSIETGKPLVEARAETHAAADQFEWYAEETKRIYGQIIEGRGPDVRMQVRFEPVGVAAAFSAWNFPALLPSRKIAAALAAGCSIIVKPASEAPGTCMMLFQAMHDAGVPPGVVTLVTGESSMITPYLIQSPIVRKISFTGSVPVGKKLLAMAAEGVKKVSMELGGHAPVLVFEDADPVAAGEAAAAAKFRNAGQVCASPCRFFVHERVYNQFGETFTRAAQQLKIGNGLDEGVQIGPLANQRGLKNALALVEDACELGAKLLAGGQRPPGFNRGYFFEPTVLGAVPDKARIMKEEPFVPIAPLTPFNDFDEVITRANSVPYGLAAYVFTRSLRTANMASEALECGMVGVNDFAIATAEAPFGGVKESGMGREGGSLGVQDYLVAKYTKFRL
jgi:succinate-semialdehyde dehydrogenase / glutarate-semialdehyde dehydrogenase